jgi:hypothetical protein
MKKEYRNYLRNSKKFKGKKSLNLIYHESEKINLTLPSRKQKIEIKRFIK